MLASDALIKACAWTTVDDVYAKCLKERRHGSALAKEALKILTLNKMTARGSKIVPGPPELKRMRTSQIGYGTATKVAEDDNDELKRKRKYVPGLNLPKKKYVDFPTKPRKFVEGVNPAGLIAFPMPETWDPEFKGFDILLACESTYLYGRAKTDSMAEKYLFFQKMANH